MGMDLTVAPIRHYENNNWWLAHTRIDFERNYEIFAQISGEHGRDKSAQVLQPIPLPPTVKFDWYEDSGLLTRIEDSYGGKLTYVVANDFHTVYIPANTGIWNRRLIEFLRGLPAQMPVVLWWH